MYSSTEQKPLHLAKDDITCKYCGVACYWQQVWGAEGKPETRLFEAGKPHVCDTSADFE
jgi:hypothetical protein